MIDKLTNITLVKYPRGWQATVWFKNPQDNRMVSSPSRSGILEAVDRILYPEKHPKPTK